MAKRVSNTVALGILLFVFILANAGWMLRSYSDLIALQLPVLAAQNAERALQDIREDLLDAENGQRDYVLSGEGDYLKRYAEAVKSVRAADAALDQYIVGMPQERASLSALHRAIEQRLTVLAASVSELSSQHPGQALAAAAEGERQMDEIRGILDHMAHDEAAWSRERLDQQAHALDRSRLIFALSCLTSLALLFAFLMLVRRMRLEHEQAELQAHEQSEGLVVALTEAARRNKQIFELTELSQYLQSSSGLDEATGLLCTYLPAILEASDGAVYLMDEARERLSLCGCWGTASYRPALLAHECWALRQGHMHRQPRELGPQSCRHLDVQYLTPGAVCIPLAVQDEQLGLLFMYRNDAQHEVDLNDRYLRAAVEQISLAIGNLKLRESLRQQSIRDVLTGLHNRRFLEESLLREVARFERQHVDDPRASLAVLMLDIDHFKQFNDRFGHETGDRVLKEVGRVLRERVRESDLVARFGGEEFSIVLPDIDQAGAIALAEQLRAGVEHIDLRGAELGSGEGAISVSISIGLAVLASPGIRPADLLRAADRALYDAKHRGRNRVSVAERFGDTVQVRGVGAVAVPQARVAVPAAPTLDYAAAASEPPGPGAP